MKSIGSVTRQARVPVSLGLSIRGLLTSDGLPATYPTRVLTAAVRSVMAFLASAKYMLVLES